MNYKGAYDAGTEYAKGDVVIYTDGVPYYLQKAAPAGTTPHDVRSWNRVPQPFSEVVVMFHGALSGMAEAQAEIGGAVAAISEVVPDDKTLVLATEDGKYEITVDDSGDTPELAVTAVEESEG
jgi:hypothetical protein